MKIAWLGAALSAAVFAPFCAHAQDAGVFEKWLTQR